MFAAAVGLSGLVATPAGAAPAQIACATGEYENVDHQCVSGPERSETPPAGATAQCGDGTYSHSKNHRGTCSRHGGVARWLA
ncbi:DUF3761 domain-containing protein [Nocardia panacis]|uniref:DUF3761 domain-containing protein n=1 Tax=Nocardia panacis TaxID=2340916 RepID=A0A3A4K0I9_9NOCA|nr:DUF3761 domain-containing protein [Nocardia panacis]